LAVVAVVIVAALLLASLYIVRAWALHCLTVDGLGRVVLAVAVHVVGMIVVVGGGMIMSKVSWSSKAEQAEGKAGSHRPKQKKVTEKVDDERKWPCSVEPVMPQRLGEGQPTAL
jgi:hypothetical protein